MRILFHKLILVFFILLIFNPSLLSQDTLRPFRTDLPPMIDGELDDLVWKKAPYITGLKTFVPDFGKKMAERTIVYMAYDRENIYFAFKCFDSRPDKIKTSITSRDNLWTDDWVCINLDSFNDQQSLYALYVNPMGIQGDSTYASGVEDRSVDLVWYSAGQLDEDGYSVEIRIPFKSIRFANKEMVEMGVIFERRISRTSEQGCYPALSPGQGLSFLTRMKPMIFHDIKHYTLFELLPALTQNQRHSIQEGRLASDEVNRELSLTAKYGISSKLVLDATYNPDFSQVEADAGQVDVNLRFDLFFPEKRPFFLEGSQYFNFGGLVYNDPFHPLLLLDPLRSIVHTRMIIDPLVGLKLAGKIGRKSTVASIFALDESPSSVDDGNQTGRYAQFAILRHKHALTRDSFLGTIYAGRKLKNSFNRIFGADGLIRVKQANIFGYHLLYSQTKRSDQTKAVNGHALSLDYLFEKRNLTINLGFQDISRDFQIDTGYITRTGVIRARAYFEPKFYPKSNVIRRIAPSFFTVQTKDQFHNMYETSNILSLNFILSWNSGVSLRYGYSTEIFLGKKYDTSSMRVEARSQPSNQLGFTFFFTSGKSIRYSRDPYQGRGNRARIVLTYQPSRKLILNLDLTYSDFFRESNSEKIFDYSIFRNKLIYQMNKYLFFRGIVEYNSFRKSLLMDFLASFTYIPGTVIQLGYGSLYEKIRWEDGVYLESQRFLETKRGLFFKISYLWRL